tara:strand:+ start:24 stop:341 length:318 start_codon:yes stop_codon:yes gene_type:complete
MLYTKFKNMLVAIVALNLFDAVATLTWIKFGFAEEANPLMEPLILHSPLLFISVKMGIVLTVCWFLWKQRENSYTLAASKIVFSAYTVLALWHMIGFYKMFCLFS